MFGWFRDLWNSVGHDIEAIWNGVVTFAHALFKVLGDAFDTINSIFTFFYEQVERLGEDAYNLAAAIWDRFAKVKSWLDNTLIPWIESGLNDIWQLAQQAAGNVYDWAVAQFDHFTRVIRGAVDNFYRDVVQPIEKAVSHAWDWIEHTFPALVEKAVGVVESWAESLFRDVWDTLTKAWDWIVNRAKQWIDFLYRYGEGLLAIAQDPFGWLGRALDGLLSRGSKWFIDRLVGALLSEGGQVEDFLADWLSV